MDEKYSWEQKLAIIQSITPHALIMIKPGKWSCAIGSVYNASTGMKIYSPHIAGTPQDAVENAFNELVHLPADHYLVSRSNGQKLKWTGFMFEHVSL